MRAQARRCAMSSSTRARYSAPPSPASGETPDLLGEHRDAGWQQLLELVRLDEPHAGSGPGTRAPRRSPSAAGRRGSPAPAPVRAGAAPRAARRPRRGRRSTSTAVPAAWPAPRRPGRRPGWPGRAPGWRRSSTADCSRPRSPYPHTSAPSRQGSRPPESSREVTNTSATGSRRQQAPRLVQVTHVEDPGGRGPQHRSSLRRWTCLHGDAPRQPCRELGTTSDADLAVDPGQVELHGLGAEEQQRRDVPGRASLGHEQRHP